MRERIGGEQRYKQKRIIEQSFKSWESKFPGNTREKKVWTRETDQTQMWRPLTWKFIEANGGACIADASLSHEEPCVFWEVGESKQLPFAVRNDDVLFGWNGKHLGNRRFLDLLSIARPAFSTESLSALQQKIIACEILNKIGKRGGRFYSVASNPILPPTLQPPEKAVSLILQTLKRGNVVLYQAPPDPSKRGRASCVLECEMAPQRSLFGKEVMLNKKSKRNPLEEA